MRTWKKIPALALVMAALLSVSAQAASAPCGAARESCWKIADLCRGWSCGEGTADLWRGLWSCRIGPACPGGTDDAETPEIPAWTPEDRPAPPEEIPEDPVPGETRPVSPDPVQETEIPSAEGVHSAYEAEVVRLVNEIRAQYGLAALTEDADLARGPGPSPRT